MPYILAIIFYALFLIAPGMPNPFDGIPFDALHEIYALVVTIPILLLIRPLAAKVSRVHFIFIPLIIGKIILGMMGLTEGLAGSYHTYNEKNPPERSTAFIHAPQGITRFDRELNFTQAGYAEHAEPMPLWFLNDNQRFAISSAEKASLPIFTEWSGYLYVPMGGMKLAAESDGLVTVIATMPQKENVVPITVRYAASKNPNRSLTLLWDAAERTPVKDSLYAKPYTVREIHMHYFLKLADMGLKIIALILCIMLVAARPKITPWHALLASTGIASFVLFTMQLIQAARHPYFAMLGGGNDPITYETYARYLQFTGNWSMAAIEQGSYYYQPYYYFVTALHYLCGEGLFPVLLMQGALLVASGIALAEVGRRIIAAHPDPRTAWPFALIAPAFVLMPHIREEAGLFFPSVFGIFFASLTALLLMYGKDAKNGSHMAYAGAGIALGLGILNRFNFLSWIPFIVIWLITGDRKWQRLLFFAIGIITIIVPIIGRNYAVAGQARIFSRSNATINFIKSAPSDAVHYMPKNTHPRLRMLDDTIFDNRATPVIAWIAENPSLYAHHIALKAKEAFLWFSWPLLFFLVASFIYIASATRGTKIDYILIGLFPIIQTATVIFASDNSFRYHLPALSFMVMWSAMLIALLQARLMQITRTRAA